MLSVALARIWHEPRVAYRYRLHAASITHGEKHKRANFFHTTAMAFARQRAATGQDDLARGQPPDFSHETAPPPNPDPLRKQMVGHLTSQAWRDFHNGKRGTGVRRLLLAVRFDPAGPRTWTSLAVYLVKLVRERGR